MKAFLGLLLFLFGIAKAPFNLRQNNPPQVLASTPTPTPTATHTATTPTPTTAPTSTTTPTPDNSAGSDQSAPADTGGGDSSGDNQPAGESSQGQSNQAAPTATPTVTSTNKPQNKQLQKQAVASEQESIDKDLEKQIGKPNVEDVQFSNDNGLSVEIKTIRAKNLQKTRTMGIPSSVTVSLDKKGEGKVVSVQTSNSGLKLTSGSVSALIKSPIFIDRTTQEVSVVNPDKSKTVIVLPDQVANTSKGKTFLTKIDKLELNGEAKYEVRGVGTAKLFGLFTVKVPMTALVDGRTGELLSSQMAGSYGFFSSVMRK